MMIGSIERLANGTYEVSICVQDGRDRTIVATEAEAIDQYRHGYALLCDPHARPEDVRVPEIIDRSKWPVFTFDVGSRAVGLTNDGVFSALELALATCQPGRRYELQIVAVELPGHVPTFVGDGI